MKPSLGRRAFVPMHLLDRATVRGVQSSLTFSETYMQRIQAVLAEYSKEVIDGDVDIDENQMSGPVKVTVNEYKVVRGGVSLPRAWAMANLKTLRWTDNTVFPMHGIDLGKGPSPRDQKQRDFFDDLLLQSTASGPQNILANADTGVGKSVAGIYVGHKLKTRTLIVVDSNKIANGWLKNFRKFYGEEWTAKYVGRVQQDKCEWQGKAFSIALVQSLARRDYGNEFYKAYGCVVYDEIQIFGSPHYSKTLGLFPARVRVGFTAENRGGSFGKLIQAHVGKTRVISKQAALPAVAYLIKNTINHAFYAGSDGAIITGLSRIEDRNESLADLITDRGYARGRQVLVLSDRTAHLVHLRKLCADRGVPLEAMGLHMGSYITDRYHVTYSYGNNAQKLVTAETLNDARGIIHQIRRGEFDKSVMPKALQKNLEKGVPVKWGTSREEYTPTQNELDDITNLCQIVFATYQIFSKGVDVPRLDMGVEALPSGNLKQPLGRILRLHHNKPQPEWYAICDVIEIPDDPFRGSSNPNVALLNMFLSGKTKTRIAALKRAKAKLSYQ